MSQIITIPLRNPLPGTESVSVPVDELPEDPTDIIGLLKEEGAPLSVVLETALAYYRKGIPSAFEKVLLAFISQDARESEQARTDKATYAMILNSLAAYYARLGRLLSDKDKKKKENYFRLATNMCNKATSLGLFEVTFVTKGMSLLFQGKDDQAADQFKNVLNQKGQNNIPALLGNACIAYKKGKYAEALAIYQNVLKSNPNCPASVRVGMAHCYHKLKKNDLAKLALQRVLELETNVEVRVDALVNLAILEANDGDGENSGKHLTEAYSLDKHNSKVLNRLSDSYFRDKKDYDGAYKLARHALENTPIEELQGESYYYLGRFSHNKKDLKVAHQMYTASAQKWPKFPLVHYGLGQVYITQGQQKKALQEFKKVLELIPGNPDALKVIGSLYAQEKNKPSSIENLEKAHQKKKDDLEITIELAQLYEENHIEEALTLYTEAVEKLHKQHAQVPAEIYNNIAVLNYHLGKYGSAESNLRKALSGSFPEITDAGISAPIKDAASKKSRLGRGLPVEHTRWALDALLFSDNGNSSSSGNSDLLAQFLQPRNVTITYNLARLYEEDSRTNLAKTFYKAILSQYPNYFDCHVRMVYIFRHENNFLAAEEYIKDVMSTDQDMQAWAHIRANLSMDQKVWNSAQKSFENILQKHRDDPYSLIQLANIYVNSAKNATDKRTKFLKIAQEYYIRVLHRDKSNAYAANGLARVLYELGHVGPAEEILTQVKDLASDIVDVWINLSNINLVQGQYDTAIRLYEVILKEFYGGHDQTIFLYIAKASFDAGYFDKAKHYLQMCLHLSPGDIDLWYNLAVTLKSRAEKIKNDTKSTSADLGSAVGDYNSAISLFETLSKPEALGVTKKGFSSRKCNQFLTLCRANVTLAAQKKDETSKIELEKDEKMKERLQKAKELQEARQRKQAEELEKEALRKLALEEEAEQVMQRTESLRNQWLEQQRLAEAKRAAKPKKDKSSTPRKRKKKNAEEEGGADDDDDGQFPEPSEPQEEGDDEIMDELSKFDEQDADTALEQIRKKQKKRKREDNEEEQQQDGEEGAPEGDGEEKSEQSGKEKKKKKRMKKRKTEERNSNAGLMDADDENDIFGDKEEGEDKNTEKKEEDNDLDKLLDDVMDDGNDMIEQEEPLPPSIEPN